MDANAGSKPSGPARSVNEKLQVLVVEDNPADADLARETLPETGLVSFGVEFAPRLSDAVERLKRGGLDLIIVDLGLPDSQGLETFRRIRAAAPHVATIVLTGNDDLDQAITAVREGAQDYLVKGQVGGGVLQRTARYAVERKRMEVALVKSQRLLSETERLGKVGGWEFDIDTRSMVWTEEIYRIHEVDLAYKPVVGEGINFYAPASRPTIERAVQRAIEHGEPFDVELEIITAKGNLRSVHAIGRPELEHRRVFGFFQDITERKQAEELIKDQLTELQRWQGAMLDREDRVLKLKFEVNELLRRLDEPIRYLSQARSLEPEA